MNKIKLSKSARRIRFLIIIIAVVLVAIAFFVLSKKGSVEKLKVVNTPNQTATVTKKPVYEPTLRPLIQSSPLGDIKPDESGKIMVVMFHSFVQQFTPTASDKGEYVMTFDDLRQLLKTLYEKNYRPISMKDYISNNINISAGYTPIVFTFDDGTPGQFNLINRDGKLVANPNSAVGIIEQFNVEHPDFNLQGTFYVNMSTDVFKGEGTLENRMKYLIDRGFEIGNHTYSHVDFNNVTTREKVQQEIGNNQKEIDKIIPGYKMTTLSLPLGHTTKNSELHTFISKGSYEGINYENKAIMLVGAEPADPSINIGFNPLKIARVRSSGYKKVECDLNWWLSQKISNYISDGNPDVISIPSSKESKINKAALNGRRISLN